MKLIIPFVSSYLTNLEKKKWVTVFKKKIKGNTIVQFEKLKPQDYRKVKVAIVANPNPKHLLKFQNLRWVQSIWVGIEDLVRNLRNTKIKIVKLKDPEMQRTMAEAVLAWVLYLHRKMYIYKSYQDKKIWKQEDYIEPRKLSVGVLGLGELGVSAAKVLIRQGYNVFGWSRNLKKISGLKSFSGNNGLKKILKVSDIVIILLPLTDKTYHFLNFKTLSNLKKGSMIINFGRGRIIKSYDLLKLLRSKHIKHAVLDVFEKEPLPKDHPFWSSKNITILPHISALTNFETASDVVKKNILVFKKSGKIPESVNVKIGY